MTKKFGRAVFATGLIKKGEHVASFDGPIYHEDDEWPPGIDNHVIQIGPHSWRDSKGLARNINHSCDPNCGVKGRFNIVAMRDIQPGEQITWDYEMTEKSWWWRLRCQCGSSDCRKWIGNYARMPKPIRARYKGFISTWLTRARKKK
ncbi:MAG: SET domain-containing protein [Bdellovibrionales bacterium]